MFLDISRFIFIIIPNQFNISIGICWQELSVLFSNAISTVIQIIYRAAPCLQGVSLFFHTRPGPRNSAVALVGLRHTFEVFPSILSLRT